MPGDTVTVGNVTVTAVKDLPGMRGDPKYMYPEVTREQLDAHKEWFNERGLLDITVGSLLVRSAGRTVLIDPGIGRPERPPFRTEGANLLGNLEAHGVRPEDVDLVVITHLHRDHVGWNTLKQGDRWVPTFPRARYLIQQKEWDYFTDPKQGEPRVYIAENVVPLAEAGVVEFVDHEKSITPDLSYFPTPGHTPDHCGILVQSQGERALITGDVTHHPVQMLETDWDHHGDFDMGQAARTRRMVAKKLEREGILALGAHWPFPCMGRVVRLNDRRVFQAAELG